MSSIDTGKLGLRIGNDENITKTNVMSHNLAGHLNHVECSKESTPVQVASTLTLTQSHDRTNEFSAHAVKDKQDKKITSKLSISATNNNLIRKDNGDVGKNSFCKRNESMTQLYNDSKRPRGRPPVCNTFPALAASKPNTHYIDSTSHRDPLTNVRTEDADSTKHKLPPYIVAHKILEKLMTDDPLSVSDLSKQISGTTKDSVSSVLEVLQVMGIVTALKWSPTGLGMPNNFDSTHCELLGTIQHNTTYYSIIGFAKGVDAVDIRTLDLAISEQKDAISKIQERVAVLEEFINSSLNCEAGAVELKVILDTLSKNENLFNDILYCILNEELTKSIENSL